MGANSTKCNHSERMRLMFPVTLVFAALLVPKIARACTCHHCPKGRFQTDINIDAFTAADTDGNSCLNWNELKEYKIQKDPALQSDQHLIQQHQTHFTTADADKSGCVTWQEALDWKAQQENGKTGRAEQGNSADILAKLTKIEKILEGDTTGNSVSRK